MVPEIPGPSQAILHPTIKPDLQPQSSPLERLTLQQQLIVLLLNLTSVEVWRRLSASGGSVDSAKHHEEALPAMEIIRHTAEGPGFPQILLREVGRCREGYDLTWRYVCHCYRGLYIIPRLSHPIYIAKAILKLIEEKLLCVIEGS